MSDIRWKGYILDYDLIFGASDEPHVVCLSPQQILTLQAIVGAVHWRTRWRSLSNSTVDEDLIDSFASKLEEDLMSVSCLSNLMFRTSPSDDCIIEYSTDGGTTWLVVWNAGKCLTRQLSDVQIGAGNYQTIKDTIIDDRDTYNDLIINIYPNWQYENGGDDAYRDEAICYIARVLLKTICDTAVEAANHTLVEDIWGVVKSIAAGIKWGYEAFLTLVDDIGDWALLPAVTLALGKSAWGIYDTLKSVDVSHFENEQAREDVACAIYYAMQGETPSFALWSHALDNFSGTEDANDIADVIKEILLDEDAFMELFKAFGDIIEVAKNGVDLGCPCEEEWYYSLDFTTLQTLPEWLTVNKGAFTPDVGIAHVDFTAEDPIRYYRGVSLAFDHPQSGNVRRFRVTFNRYFGIWDNSSTAANWEYIQSPQTLAADPQNAAQAGDDRWEEVAAEPGNYTQTGCAVYSSRRYDPAYGGTVLIKKVEWWGTGDNPFT